MTSQTTNTLDLAGSAAWRGAGAGNGNARGADNLALQLFETLYCDRLGNVRRPMLLFGIIVVDVILIICSGLAAWSFISPSEHAAAVWPLLLAGPWFIVAMLGANWAYSVSALRRPAAQMGKTASATATALLVITGFFYITGIALVSPALLVTWSAFTIVSISIARLAAGRLANRLAAAGRLRRRAVIVGGGEDASTLIDLLGSEREHLQILGVFDDRICPRDGASDHDTALARLGSFDELETFCREAGVELLIVNVPTAAEERLVEIARQLMSLPVDIRISAHTSKLLFDRKAYSYIGKVPMLPLLDRPLSDRDRMIKNIEDRLLAVALMIIAAPVMAIVAIAVRLESRGPVLFRQQRFGFNNELIEVYKFRSMFTDMSDAAAAKLVTKDDPRVTRVGRIIRKTSLDELPQLFNVLKGEMSIVGPRPHALQAKAGDDLYHDAVRSYFARHKVKPGITGWAQINGWRGETDTLEKIEQRVAHDMHYINHWSVLLDLYIVALTPFSLIGGKNAY